MNLLYPYTLNEAVCSCRTITPAYNASYETTPNSSQESKTLLSSASARQARRRHIALGVPNSAKLPSATACRGARAPVALARAGSALGCWCTCLVVATLENRALVYAPHLHDHWARKRRGPLPLIYLVVHTTQIQNFAAAAAAAVCLVRLGLSKKMIAFFIFNSAAGYLFFVRQ